MSALPSLTRKMYGPQRKQKSVVPAWTATQLFDCHTGILYRPRYSVPCVVCIDIELKLIAFSINTSSTKFHQNHSVVSCDTVDGHDHALSCSQPVQRFPWIYSSCRGTDPSLAYCQEIQICNFLTIPVIISNPYLAKFLKSERVEVLLYPVRSDSHKSIAPEGFQASCICPYGKFSM